MASNTDLKMGEIVSLDRQIETLMECKPLPENEVRALCERVCIHILTDKILIIL